MSRSVSGSNSSMLLGVVMPSQISFSLAHTLPSSLSPNFLSDQKALLRSNSCIGRCCEGYILGLWSVSLSAEISTLRPNTRSLPPSRRSTCRRKSSSPGTIWDDA